MGFWWLRAVVMMGLCWIRVVELMAVMVVMEFWDVLSMASLNRSDTVVLVALVVVLMVL